jgi:L,D-transpeptidase YcbB
MFRALTALILLALGAAAPAHARPPFPIEPVDIPPSIQQGVDMIYIDPELLPAIRRNEELLEELGLGAGEEASAELLLAANPLYTRLRRGLVRYRLTWGGLPQVAIPPGPALRPGAEGERVALLRERLGLSPGASFDQELARAVRLYQQAHAIRPDGIAGAETIASLNLGSAHYERLLSINIERARRLPGAPRGGRYILVDAGGAEIHLVEDGEIKDSMKAVVGKPESATPMMAAMIRYASVNPYWNIPVDLAQTLIAPRVLANGLSHLQAGRYEILSDWTDEADIVDPASIDWASVADGSTEIRVRQLPGRGNSMGDIKFMMPNEFGIYLHDTPDKSVFRNEDRWISNGCVRVEDAARLAKWLFGSMPRGRDPNVEEDVELPEPVPVYITYLTAGASAAGVVFRKDPYQRDAVLLAASAPWR